MANLEKPIKPTLGEFNLTEEQVAVLSNFKDSCETKAKNILRIAFGLLVAISVLVIISNELHKGFIILAIIGSAIVSWGITPSLLKAITKRELSGLIFEGTKNRTITDYQERHSRFSSSMVEYKNKNDLFERVLRRATWNYWLSLNPTDFEEAVADLFLDKGYEVFTTPATGDHGVDLYLKRDGKTSVVQCKTYKKVLGPSAVRDLYGTMVAQEAEEAFLAAPGGFSKATKEFCKGKPIKLLDLDELTQMSYEFENYIPHWIDSAKSMDDIVKGLNKNVLGKPYRRRQR